jgi:hypothetical protein
MSINSFTSSSAISFENLTRVCPPVEDGGLIFEISLVNAKGKRQKWRYAAEGDSLPMRLLFHFFILPFYFCLPAHRLIGKTAPVSAGLVIVESVSRTTALGRSPFARGLLQMVAPLDATQSQRFA